MTLSQSDVILRLQDMSARTSDILKHLSEAFSCSDIHSDWSMGLIYFSRFNSDVLDHALAQKDPQEIIAFCPKWLLTAQTQSTAVTTKLYNRTSQGELRRDEEQPAGDFFEQLCARQNHDQASISGGAFADKGFSGGLAGFIGYDVTAMHQSHALRPVMDGTSPPKLVAAMGEYDIFLKRAERGWTLYGPNDQSLASLYEQIKRRLALLTDTDHPQACGETHQTTITTDLNRFSVVKTFQPVWSKLDYIKAFEHIQSYLYAGDCYQVNLTQPFVATATGRLLDTLDDLLALTQAPYAGYMQVGAHELLSCSPELFLAFTGQVEGQANTVITRPIKGTFPRSADMQTDLDNKNKLSDSEKDQSENLMIVDLLRNDLSRHAVVGSVKVPILFEIESFAQVHHLVSEVRAQLAVGVSPLDVLIDALPGGSITGAPKKRAMEIIAELEARPRGAYCGSFGYLNHDGSGQFNILIRTLQKNHDEVVAWAGGGITVASQVDAEYQECLDKIGAILNCIDQYAV